MNKKIIIIFCFLLLTSIAYTSQRGIKITTTTGKDISLYTDYYALVIGNSNYDNWPDLPNARKDAEEVAGMLRELGFEVTLRTDLNSDEMIDALNDFTYNYGNIDDRALIFYYAGHGETEILADGNKLGFIIPTDSPLIERDPSEFTKKAISMTQIEDYTLKIKSKHVLMLFDSCFSGSIFSLGRAAPKNITEKVAKPVRQFITAGNENEIVPDKSMFKTCLIDGLKEGYADLNDDSYITGRELGSYLQDNVINYTNGAQHPQFGTIRNPKLDKGDFVFAMSSKPIEPGTEIESKTSPPVEFPEIKIYDKKPVSLKIPSKRFTIGIKGGYNYSFLSLDINISENSDIDNVNTWFHPSGLYSGIYINYILNKILALQFEILYSDKGSYTTLYGKDYINIKDHVLLRYLEFHLFPKINVYKSKKNVEINLTLGFNSNFALPNGADHSDVEFVLGCSMSFNKFTLEYKYSHGLKRDGPRVTGTINQYIVDYEIKYRNRVMSLGLEYTF